LLKALFDFIRVRSYHDHAEKMYKLENQGKENIKELLLDMLNHRTHIDRTFDALKKRIGGYSDDEVRKLLMELSACRT
jgi:DNA-binding PadR family transcriptional regulator